MTENAQAHNKKVLEARSTEELLPDVINYLDVGVLVLDDNFDVVLWNQWFEEYTGISEQDSLGENINALMSLPTEGRLMNAIRQAVELGMSSFLSTTFNKTPFPLYKRNKKGEKLHAIKQLIMIKSLMGADKKRSCLIQVIDMTNADRREQIMKQQAKELEETNNNLEQFAYIASHDLQEPLRTIRCFGEILLSSEEQLSDVNKDYLSRIINSSDRLQTMISDLLVFSSVSTLKNKLEEVDLNDVIKGILLEMEVRVRETQAQVTTNDLPLVKGDKGQLHQLFQNLITNALKFQLPEEKPVVRIESYASDNEGLIKINVIDNGIGFEPKYAEKIFEFSERIHNRKHYSGNGIGLAICKKIVDRHSGKISAQSKPGEGATFVIELPLSDGQSAKKAIAS